MIEVDATFTLNQFTLTMVYLALAAVMYLCFYLGYRLGSRSDYEARQARENSKLCLNQLRLMEPLILKTREKIKRAINKDNDKHVHSKKTV